MGPRGIEASVQCPNRYLEIEKSHISDTSQYVMRDLYNRKKKVENWLKKVDDLDDPDKTDILRLVEHMQDKERSILWIVRCMVVLISVRMQIGKPFRYTTKDDIRAILKSMEQRGYKASTNEKCR